MKREYLIELREAKNMTQQNVIDRIGISQVYYSLIENGARQSDMSLSTMQKLAAAFGVSVSDIVSAETEYQAKTDQPSVKGEPTQ